MLGISAFSVHEHCLNQPMLVSTTLYLSTMTSLVTSYIAAKNIYHETCFLYQMAPMVHCPCPLFQGWAIVLTNPCTLSCNDNLFIALKMHNKSISLEGWLVPCPYGQIWLQIMLLCGCAPTVVWIKKIEFFSNGTRTALVTWSLSPLVSSSYIIM